MSNSLFNNLGNQIINESGIMDIVKQVGEFQKTFTGNPQQEVQKLLDNGQLSQAQFNQFAQIANQVMPFLPK